MEPGDASSPCPPPHLTTADAARYCGFKTSGALRKAKLEGRIAPAFRRGGKQHATWMWAVTELDVSCEGSPRLRCRRIVRVRLQQEKHMEKWIQQWNTWVAPTKLPGVWKTKTEAYLVRARVTNPTTGKLEEIRRVLDARDEITDEVTAFNWLQNEKNRIKAGIALTNGAPKQRFAD